MSVIHSWATSAEIAQRSSVRCEVTSERQTGMASFGATFRVVVSPTSLAHSTLDLFELRQRGDVVAVAHPAPGAGIPT